MSMYLFLLKTHNNMETVLLRRTAPVNFMKDVDREKVKGLFVLYIFLVE